MESSAWPEITTAIAASPYPIQILPADDEAAAACLTRLGVTTKSWLGAVVTNTGGLLIDHGWLRVLGSGHGALVDVVSAIDVDGLLVVGYDVMGGRFAWLRAPAACRPTVHYFGPDELAWQDLEQGYADWLYAVIAGSLTGFYETLRWPAWEREIAALGLDQGISAFPPLWSEQGRDVGATTRRAVPMAELMAYYRATAGQLGPGDSS